MSPRRTWWQRFKDGCWTSVLVSLGLAVVAVVGHVFVTSLTHASALERHGLRAEATVREVETRRASRSARVTFLTADGQFVSARVDQTGRRPRRQVGETMTVLYDPKNPDGNVVDAAMGPNRNGALLVVVLVGPFLLLSWWAGGFSRRARRFRREQDLFQG